MKKTCYYKSGKKEEPFLKNKGETIILCIQYTEIYDR